MVQADSAATLADPAHRASVGKTSSASFSQSIVPVSVASSTVETFVVTVVVMHQSSPRTVARGIAGKPDFTPSRSAFPIRPVRPRRTDHHRRVIARLTTSATSLSVSALSSISVWDKTVRTTTSAAPSGLKAS